MSENPPDPTPDQTPFHQSVYTCTTDDRVIELDFNLTVTLNPGALDVLDIKELTREIAEAITDAHDRSSLLGHDVYDGMVPDTEDIVSVELKYLTQRTVPLSFPL